MNNIAGKTLASWGSIGNTRVQLAGKTPECLPLSCWFLDSNVQDSHDSSIILRRFRLSTILQDLEADFNSMDYNRPPFEYRWTLALCYLLEHCFSVFLIFLKYWLALLLEKNNLRRAYAFLQPFAEFIGELKMLKKY